MSCMLQSQWLIMSYSIWLIVMKRLVLYMRYCRFFLRFGGTVPTQHNLLLKYSKIKTVGIIVYRYIATTFFFFSFDVSVSLQLLSPDQDLKGNGYGFGI